MKILGLVLPLVLFSGFAAGQQTVLSRCQQVTQLQRLQQSAKMSIPQEIVTAADACRQYTDALGGLNLAKMRQQEANAEAVLEQLNLTGAELFTRLVAMLPVVDPMQRFALLVDLAKQAFNLGRFDDARTYASQLLQEASQYSGNWNYGNAIYYGNFVLGRLALRDGDPSAAGRYLLAAGATTGSPQLDSFGPNLTLAKELLEKGQGDVVLQFFAECKKFWRMDRGKLDEWSATIRGGGVPQFTQNLNY